MSQLFQGKAESYEKYRPKFSSGLFQFLEFQLGLDLKHQQPRLMDLGCGTGNLTLPLSRYFKEVIGVDPSGDMLNAAKNVADKMHCKNIQWVQSRAEDLSEITVKFDLIAIANAFHWMNHEVVVPWILDHLNENSCLVLIGSYKSFWEGVVDWQIALNAIVEKWFGAEKQEVLGKIIPGGTLEWEIKLSHYPFKRIDTHSVPEKRIWTVEMLIGYLYSVSFITKEKIKDRTDEFEKEIEDALLGINSKNQFIEEHEISVIIAKK